MFKVWLNRILSVALSLQLVGISPTLMANTSKKDSQKACAELLGASATEDSELKKWQVSLQSLHSKIIEKHPFNSDPWYDTFNLDAATEKIERLSLDKNLPSIVQETRSLLIDAKENEQTRIDLYKKVKVAAENLLKTESPNQRQIFQTLIALEFLEAHFGIVLAESDGAIPFNEQDDKAKPDEKKDDSSQSEPEEESQSPDYPKDPPKVSQSTNHDTDNKSNAKQEPIQVVHLNLKANYFKTVNYNQIQLKNNAALNLASPIPGLDRQIKSGTSSVKLKLNLGSKKDVALLLPPDFEPLKPLRQATITREQNGQYRLKSSISEIELSLKKADERLNPIQVEFLKKKVGVARSELPQEMIDLIDRLKTSDPLTIARKLEGYMHHRLLYKVDASADGPFEALRKGSIQCSYAGWILAAILRDFFGIPARTVWGYRAQVDKQNANYSVLNMPNTAHMWVEIYHDNRWVTFDPTPARKDRQTKDESDPNGSADQNKDFDDEFAVQDDSKKDDAKVDGEKNTSEEKKGKDDKNKNDKSKNDNNQNETDKDKSKEDSKVSGGSMSDSEVEQILNELTIGSLSAKHNYHNNKLFGRYLRVILREALNPNKDTSASLKQILDLKTALKKKSQRDADVDLIIEEAIPLLQYRQGAVDDELLILSKQVKEASLTSTFKRILNIEDRVKLYLRVLSATLHKGAQLSPDYGVTLEAIKKIKAQYLTLVKPGYEDVNLVQKFLREVPGHTAQLFKKRFGIESVGFNPPTKNAAAALKNAQVRDLNLIRVLYPMTNFIMDSVPSPAFRQSKTYSSDARRPRRDLLPMKTLRDRKMSTKLDRHMGWYEAMATGNAFTKLRRKPILIPDPGGITDPKRITIVLYDQSGSMADQPGLYQAGLIAAFTDRALSDIGANGKHRHKAVLIGFGDQINGIDQILNSTDAYRIVGDYKNLLKNMGQGTNIQLALEEAFRAIYDAQKRNGEPLAAANIILMSDGGSTVDYTKLAALRAKISEKTPIKMMFVAVNGTNKDLQDLANDSKEKFRNAAYNSRRIGTNESYYIEKSSEDIGAALKKSTEALTVNGSRDYHSDRNPSELPLLTSQLLLEASRAIRRAMDQTASQLNPKSLNAWRDEVERIRFKESRNEDTSPFRSAISMLRAHRSEMIQNQDIALMTKVIDHILRDIEALTSRSLDSLTNHETETLKHLLREAMSGKL